MYTKSSVVAQGCVNCGKILSLMCYQHGLSNPKLIEKIQR